MAPASAPSYVRLNDRLARGCLADVGGNSGWSISGADVQEYPEDPLAQRFVRNQIRQGNLEEASRAEYEAIHEDDDAEDTPRVIMSVDKTPHQEHKVLEKAAGQKGRLETARKAQSRRLLGEDDDEAEVETGARTVVGRQQGGFARAGVPSEGLPSKDSGDDEGSSQSYGNMRKDDLVAEAARRGLDDTGSAKELRERLKADDADNSGD